jgi:hypothetical protein
MRWVKRILVVLLVLFVLVGLLTGGAAWYLTPAAGPALPAFVPNDAVAVVHIKKATALWDALENDAAVQKLLKTQVVQDLGVERMATQWRDLRKQIKERFDQELDPDTVGKLLVDDVLVVGLPHTPGVKPEGYVVFRTGLIGNAAARLGIGLDEGELAGQPTGTLQSGQPFALMGDAFVVASNRDALARALQTATEGGERPERLDPVPDTDYRVALRLTHKQFPLDALSRAKVREIQVESDRPPQDVPFNVFLSQILLDWLALPWPVERIETAFARDGEDITEETRITYQPQAQASGAQRSTAAAQRLLRSLRERQPQPWPLTEFLPADTLVARSWQPHANWYATALIDLVPLPAELAQSREVAETAGREAEAWVMQDLMPALDDVVGMAVVPHERGLGESKPPALQWFVPVLMPRQAREALEDGLQNRMNRLLAQAGVQGTAPRLLVSQEFDAGRVYVLPTSGEDAELTPAMAFADGMFVISTSLKSLNQTQKRAAADGAPMQRQSDAILKLLQTPAHHHLYYRAPGDWDQMWQLLERYQDRMNAQQQRAVQTRSSEQNQSPEDKWGKLKEVLELVQRLGRVTIFEGEDSALIRGRWRFDVSQP